MLTKLFNSIGEIFMSKKKSKSSTPATHKDKYVAAPKGPKVAAKKRTKKAK